MPSRRDKGERVASDIYDIHDAQAFDLQPLSKLKFKLASATVADLNQAESAIWDLNQRESSLDREVCADAMLSIEAMASMRMNGRSPSARDVFLELADVKVHNTQPGEFARRYEHDRAALEYALGLSGEGCSLEVLRDVQARSLPLRHGKAGGKFRTNLRQVGGSRYHSFGTVYTMPRPEDIEDLMLDLSAFMNLEEIPAVEQAGIAHAQLVNIHPFERGNGKIARMLVNMAFSYRGIAPRYLLPITPVVTTSSHDYVEGINACKFDGSETADEVDRRLNAWLSYFSTCCVKAASLSATFMTACEQAARENTERLKARRGSAAAEIVKLLPACPAFGVAEAAERAGCSFKRASVACKTLEEAGVLRLVNEVKRNRVYYSQEVLDAYLNIDALR